MTNQTENNTPPTGGCFATDKIIVEGLPVGYMYREEPDEEEEGDTGWRFFSGTEDEEYLDDPDNLDYYDLNTLINADATIIPHLNLPIGTALERVEDKDEFKVVEEEGGE